MSRPSPEPQIELTGRLALRPMQATATLGVSDKAPRDSAAAEVPQ